MLQVYKKKSKDHSSSFPLWKTPSKTKNKLKMKWLENEAKGTEASVFQLNIVWSAWLYYSQPLCQIS